MNLIGRSEELKLLENSFGSNKPEFIAVYGRRRVGKTFLIRQFFSGKNAIFFNVTGLKNGALIEQLENFTKQISTIFYQDADLKPAVNWRQAFEQLTKAFSLATKNKKIVLFFDELPWMVTRNSKLLQTIDYYWNQYWSNDKRIKLIICGSSASWIINNIINNKGGLHNRITEKIHLESFNLADTELYLHNQGAKLNRQQILLIYMLLGGIPYYLSKVKKGLSAAQIIEQLAFSKNAFLLDEFDNLFAALFDNSDNHIQILRIIANNHYGIGQRKLLEELGKYAIGGGGLKQLKELEETGFIMSFKPLYHEKRGIYYRLADEFTLFYFRWIEPIRDTLQKKSFTKGNWEILQTTPEWHSWLGYAFETICYKHLPAIRKALKINPTAIASSWRYVPRKASINKGAQIDLLFDRKDKAITLCEIKYSEKPFVLTKEYADILIRKQEIFKTTTRTKKQLFIALISANGLKNTIYADNLLAGVVTLDNLFEEA